MFQEPDHELDLTMPATAPEPPVKPEWKRDAEARLRDYEAEEKKVIEEKRRADRDFIKVYPQGWQKLRQLIDEYPIAAKMYSFLAEHIDAQAGAVIASQALLAEELNISDRTIRKISKFLEERGALLRIKIQGNLYAYALNPEQVWKSWKDSKNYSAFNTCTLARSKDNPDIKRRIKVMLKNQNQPALPGFEDMGAAEPEPKEGQ